MPVKVLLQEVRKSQGLSQNELARLIQMSPQNIQKIEQGDAKSLTFITLERLCKALGCQPGDLLIYEDEPGDGEASEVNAKSIATSSSKYNAETDELRHPKRPRSLIRVISKILESA